MSDRKQSRVRIDAICNAIKKGEYDDKLGDIQKAVSERQDFKRKELLALVQEVYGPNATISTHKQPGIGGTFPRGGNISVDVVSGSKLDVPVEGGTQTAPSALDEVESESAAPVAENEVQLPPEGPDANGYESRSPVIGPVNPS